MKNDITFKWGTAGFYNVNTIANSKLGEMVNPYYCHVEDEVGYFIPLPEAIRLGNPAALAFVDKWLDVATQAQKDWCEYNPETNNFGGGK